MLKVLLVEDDEYDCNMTVAKLGKECQVTIAKTSDEGLAILESDSSFDFLLYDYGAGGITLEEKKESFDRIADLCNRLNINITVLSGARVPNTILETIKNKGGEFRTKNEVKDSINPNSLMSLLGMEYLNDKSAKDKQRSITVRKIEQEIVRFNVEVQQLKERMISELNQVRIGNQSVSNAVSRLTQKIQLIENKADDIKTIVKKDKSEIDDRIESLEQNLIDFKYQLNNMGSNKSATINTIGVIVAATITGAISVAVIFLTKK